MARLNKIKGVSSGITQIDFSYFFDRPAVYKAMSKANKKALSKAGAFVRTRAKRSIRKRKKISKPNSPPSSHSGELRRLIFFSYDFNTDSVVIGPLLFKGKKGAQTVPNILEKGGTKRYKGKPRRYKPRPFMKPALKEEVKEGNIPKQWKNSIS